MTAILTPDQRVRVFVSSTLEELADERIAARQAIEALHLTPVLFELGARPHPPQELYRAYLDQSHVFVAIYWQRYGWVAPGMEISGLEDELRLAGDRPKLVYLKRPAPDREPRLDQMLDVVRDSGVSYKAFSTPTELEEVLAHDLSTLLSERFQSGGEPPPRGASSPPRALPASATSFVGRETEVEDVLDALRSNDVRLVTLVGPGGIGKTRLALEVAHRGTASWPDGVTFVPLESVADAGAIAPAIVRALDLDERGAEDPLDVLQAHFSERRALLVLDNFEHLVEGAGQVADLLSVAAGLTILVTSREPLRVRGEREVVVSALLPDEAVQLFLERARGGTTPEHDGEDHRAIDAICDRLDRVPLAIELAAARTRLLAPRDILERLGRRLDFLVAGPRDAPERQQTLRATIAWSYDLLDPEHQAAFAALGTFAGPFTDVAAAAVTGADDGLGVLASLVDKSLLVVEPPGAEVRVRMLGTVRDFALEQLVERGELAACRDRHAAHIQALAVAAAGPLRTTEQSRWLDRLDADAANIRVALEWWADQQRYDELGHVVWYLWVVAWLRGYLREIRELLDRVLADPALTGRARTRVVATAGILDVYRGATESVALLDEAVVRAREEGAEEVLAATSMQLAIAGGRGDMDEALRLFRKLGDEWGVAATLCAKAWVHVNLDDFDGADVVFDEAEAAAERLSDDFVVAMILANVAERRTHEGDVAESSALLSASVTRYQRLRAAYPASFAVEAAAHLAVRRGRLIDAARLLAGAEAMRASIEAVWTPAQQRHDRLVATVRDQLDRAAFDEAWRASEGLEYSAVLELVLETIAS